MNAIVIDCGPFIFLRKLTWWYFRTSDLGLCFWKYLQKTNCMFAFVDANFIKIIKELDSASGSQGNCLRNCDLT